MAKRETPLFIIDTCRAHKQGECDFMVCTDRDNGFIAKLDYVDGDITEVGDDYRIGYPNNGCSLRMQIQRYIGQNVTTQSVKTLMKKGMEQYVAIVRRVVDIDNPSKEDCVKFIDMLIKGNRPNLTSEKDNAKRQMVSTSIQLLEATKDYLK